MTVLCNLEQLAKITEASAGEFYHSLAPEMDATVKCILQKKNTTTSTMSSTFKKNLKDVYQMTLKVWIVHVSFL